MADYLLLFLRSNDYAVNVVLYLVGTIFIVLAYMRVVRIFFEERKTSLIVYMASCLLFWFLWWFNILILGPLETVNIIPVPIINIVCSFILTLNYKGNIAKRLVAAAFAYTFIRVVDSFIFALYRQILFPVISEIGLMSAEGGYPMGYRMIFVTAGIYLAVLLSVIGIKNIGKNSHHPKLFYVPLLITPAASLFLFILNEFYHYSPLNPVQDVLIFTGVLLVNIVALYIYDSLAGSYVDKLKFILNAQEREYYYAQCRIMQESVDSVKSFKHDITNHLAALERHIESSPEDAKNYLVKLRGGIQMSEVFSETGNISFDSIINYKLAKAKEMGAAIDFHIAIPADLDMEVSDVVAILGNLLDNAINAVNKTEDKRITLNIRYDKGRVLIKTENTFDGQVRYSGEILVSTTEGNGHGYGLGNVRKAAEKYNGNVKISYSENVFSIDVLLYV